MNHHKNLLSAETGAVLIPALCVTVLAAGLTAFLQVVTHASYLERRADTERTLAHYVLDAALIESQTDFAAGLDGVIGTEQQPATFNGGEFWVEVTDLGGGFTSLIGVATAGGQSAVAEVILQDAPGLPPWAEYAAFGADGIKLNSLIC